MVGVVVGGEAKGSVALAGCRAPALSQRRPNFASDLWDLERDSRIPCHYGGYLRG